MSLVTHLHVHSHFTLLGATASIHSLVSAAAADQMSHLALTDLNVLYGAVAFSQACKAAAIQPIVGMTLRVQLPNNLQPPFAPQASPAQTVSSMQQVASEQIVLLATNRTGYRSLCRLSSSLQSSPERETLVQQGVRWEALKDERAGLIAIAGGRKSWIQQAVSLGDNKFITSYLGRFAGLFDDYGYLALELQSAADTPSAREISKLADRFGLPCVAVQPIYTLQAEERARLRLLAAIDRNCKLNDVPASALPGEDDPAVSLHWLHPEEMQTRFAAFAPALAATNALAARCQPALPDGKPIFPLLHLPQNVSPEEALRKLAHEGMLRHFQSSPGEAECGAENGAESGATRATTIEQRLNDELALIARTGYAPLFLVVADVVRFARSQGIPVSTRGSVANSLVAYCTAITTVDPIANDLLFERFLNPERGNPPDIDLDFCSVRRDEVLDYVRRTYGEDRVALVATISTMRPRSAVGESAKAYGMDEAASEQLVKLLPDEWHPDPRRRVHSTPDALLAKLKTAEERQVVSAAYELIGTPHHLSIHPGGLVITPGPMTDFAPVQSTPKGFLIIQFDHQDAETIGLAKLDLLGIRALTVLADAAALVKRYFAPEFTLESIPIDDPQTAHMLENGDTIGVFQCESSGARRTLRQLKAKNIADLAVANAFFKPGPATGGMATSFVRRYRGDEPTSYLHPSLEPILGFTKGVLIFQEQVLRVARQIAGLSWAEADYLRKGMSKFQADAMEQIRARFVEGCVKVSGFRQEQATTLWEQVEAFAGYGFNQGHATAYADVSYRSAWLKAHYPAAFLAARLANYGGFHHPAIYIAEARQQGIAVRPPHVNHSGYHFTLGSERRAGDALPPPVLWMGLGQVRNLRHGAIDDILSQRSRQPFADLDDLLDRVALQQREVSNLIECGALDGLAESRAELLNLAGNRNTGRRQQLAFDFAAPAVEPETSEQRLRWERELLGQPVSVDPLQIALAQSANKKGLTLAQIEERQGQPVQFAGYRLPGWTGGKGFYISDGVRYAIAIPTGNPATPRSWSPIQMTGRWLVDEWGGGWLQIEKWGNIGTLA